MLKGALMLHYSNEVMHHIKQSKPDNHYHMGEAVQELWEARGWQGKIRMLRQTWDRPPQQYQQQQQTSRPISKGDDNHPRKRSEGESLSTGGGAGHSHQRGGSGYPTPQDRVRVLVKVRVGLGSKLRALDAGSRDTIKMNVRKSRLGYLE